MKYLGNGSKVTGEVTLGALGNTAAAPRDEDILR